MYAPLAPIWSGRGGAAPPPPSPMPPMLGCDIVWIAPYRLYMMIILLKAGPVVVVVADDDVIEVGDSSSVFLLFD